MKKLKILSCSRANAWYKDKIGQTVPYLGDTGTEYKSREEAGYVNFIRYCDAEIVNEEGSIEDWRDNIPSSGVLCKVWDESTDILYFDVIVAYDIFYSYPYISLGSFYKNAIPICGVTQLVIEEKYKKYHE